MRMEAAARPGFRRFKSFRGFKGKVSPLRGDEYIVIVTGFALVSRMLHDKESEPPSLGRGRSRRRRIGASVLFKIYQTYPQGFAQLHSGRATKGKRPYGQARRLTSPDLAILCRIATWGRSLTLRDWLSAPSSF